MTELRKDRVTWGKGPVDLAGPELKVGDKAPSSFTLSANDLSDVNGDALAGKARIIAAVPSLDTPVCDLEIKRFNSEASKLAGVTVYVTSLDLPFAQKRWCGASGSENVQTLSDYKHRSFGEAYGVLAPSKGLFARAVFVIGADDVIKHVEYVASVGTEPNYDAALAAAKSL